MVGRITDDVEGRFQLEETLFPVFTPVCRIERNRHSEATSGLKTGVSVARIGILSPGTVQLQCEWSGSKLILSRNPVACA